MWFKSTQREIVNQIKDSQNKLQQCNILIGKSAIRILFGISGVNSSLLVISSMDVGYVPVQLFGEHC
jgi:hypothetical protein